MIYSIASWNVNSINARIDHLVQYLEQNEFDVIGLQELKCVDEQFPIEPILDLGYEVVLSGQKTYNGVAILSKGEATEVMTALPNYPDPQKRFIAATIDDIRVINLYVPNGQAVDSEKYQYKLEWLEALIEFMAEERERYPNMVVMGDFNIAPTDEDVYDPKLWKDTLLVSTKERKLLQCLLRLGLVDSFSMFNHPKDTFSWWDYRGGSFRQNKGLRIDLALLGGALVDKCQFSTIDKAPRAWPRPSDHAPVIVSLAM